MNLVSEIIPQALMVISASGVLFILGRKFPQSARDVEKERASLLTTAPVTSTSARFAVTKKNISESLSKGMEKLLRKIKVLALKSDAKLMELIRDLQKKREPNQVNQPQPPVLRNEQAYRGGQLHSLENRGRETVLNRMATIKQKLQANRQIARIRSLRKEKDVPVLQREIDDKPSQPAPQRSVNVEEGRRAMFEMKEKVLIKRISLNPRNDDAYVDLGRLYRDAENWGDAKASFEQALKINKGNVIAKKLLKEVEEKMPT